eukprot:CAMPEP_0172557006 /NCGR_PEP_ID=MMETSP1067-20121228/70855_1 /TAXON_ID=265564 ORGANISM="Thalassiosira punctigera, Strain Tpunct2005C2" /NCGR_SAMPLE_ID=MMETSP1067 /ASSEMBLY_ACC=CAM_ASM_000444 /LENGTH=506 /DNA_ID=CAMNT_0013345967 /DNA_START=356 /DNA_END=1876 /DNA_ORIENTATION=-
MNYSTFLELHRPKHHSGNSTSAASNNSTNSVSSNSTDSTVKAYFPDFCEDCMWSGQLTCAGRADFLRNRYNTPNPQDAVMNDRKVCKNPPLQIFWRDDGIDELDSIFAQPRMSRGNATTSPMLGRISIYFYETLRKDVGVDLVENMRRQYADRNNTETNAQADIAIIDLFRTFPGRTDDAAMADAFVVPYPHASHCVSKPTGVWMAACRHIAHELMQGGVLNKLDHYVGNHKRHLFLNVINQGNSNPTMRETPLSLTIGPRYKSTNIIVPYLNNLPSFQPSAIRGRGEGWWTRPRTYSVTYFFGMSNSKMRHSPRLYRKLFMEEVQNNWPETVGGLPYAIRVMTKRNKPPSRLFTHMYRDSVFCPTFPGDTPPQKRFFDVIMMGCIPVVLEFDTNEGKKSWHQPGGQPIENSYPWIKGSNSTDPSNEIDYRSFVVAVTGGVENVRPTVEAIMRNYTEVRRRQLALMEVAPYFSYGMGEDAHRYPDAFSKILSALRYYLDGPYLGMR